MLRGVIDDEAWGSLNRKARQEVVKLGGFRLSLEPVDHCW